MNQRTTSSIAIKRPTGESSSDTIVTVPITAKSVRRYKLMEEDCIVLSFSLLEATHFAIGDYIEDELFGKFIITKEQMPKYNGTTGGYDYDLIFEAEYMAWRNHIFMLTTTLADDQTERIRKETNWRLTANLATHAQEVLYNVYVLGLGNYSLNIQNSAERKEEVKYLQYAGTDIISALKSMADTWECEWWVTEEDKTLHFGKCEGSDTPMLFSLATNVESIDIADNRKEYANRYYIFGGTKNVPSTYGKKLIFTCTTYDNGYFEDANRKVHANMVSESAVGYGVKFAKAISDSTTQLPSYALINEETKPNVKAGTYHISGEVTFNMSGYQASNANSVSVSVQLYDSTHNTLLANLGEHFENIDDTTGVAIVLPLEKDIDISDDIAVTLRATAVCDYSMLQGTIQFDFETDMTMKGDSAMSSVSLKLQVNGEGDEYDVTLNPDNVMYSTILHFDDDIPPNFGTGTQYALSPLNAKIPASYYTDTDYEDPAAIAKIGEKRIRMYDDTEVEGEEIGYISYLDLYPTNHVSQRAEKAVVFEEVYPRCMLVIDSPIYSEMKLYEEELEDGSKNQWWWQQYSFKAHTLGGSADDFPFSTDYIMDGHKLEGIFGTPTDETTYADAMNIDGYEPTSGGHKLAGMTFELGFRNSDKMYTIVRNEEYGTFVPNEWLKPSVGDSFVLVGWNPLVMDDLGLLRKAEIALKSKVDEYMQAVEEGQFTFTCKMMSDFAFPLGVAESARPLYTSDDLPVEEAGGAWLYVRSGSDVYALPVAGAKVTIEHDALASNKTSRVIGYEFKLDMPWDTPTYTIGETQAYSRLAQIEKEITNLK